MSELGELFGDWKAHKQAKRAANRESSPDVLRSRGVSFVTRNDGAHLIVTHNDTTVDFWPGTGKWIVRADGRNGRGVFRLMSYLGVNHSPKEQAS